MKGRGLPGSCDHFRDSREELKASPRAKVELDHFKGSFPKEFKQVTSYPPPRARECRHGGLCSTGLGGQGRACRIIPLDEASLPHPISSHCLRDTVILHRSVCW